jgi:plastocyanin
MLARASFALLITLAACGGDDGNKATPDAAAPTTDAAPVNKVKTVTCPATPALVVTTTDNTSTAQYVFTPTSNTIAVGGIVQFMMPSTHNVAPYTGMPTDPGLKVDFGGNACLQFTAAGTYTFLCTAHSFHANIIVQQTDVQ